MSAIARIRAQTLDFHQTMGDYELQFNRQQRFIARERLFDLTEQSVSVSNKQAFESAAFAVIALGLAVSTLFVGQTVKVFLENASRVSSIAQDSLRSMHEGEKTRLQTTSSLVLNDELPQISSKERADEEFLNQLIQHYRKMLQDESESKKIR